MRQKIWISICSLMILTFVSIAYVYVQPSEMPENPPTIVVPDEQIPLSGGYVQITSGKDDLNLIPDKYNTGVLQPETLKLVAGEGTYQGVFFCYYNGDKLKLDFKYQNKSLAGNSVVIVENQDFSNYPIVCLNENIDTAKTVIFKNCRFSSFSNARSEQPIQYQFVNCEFERFYGSNATFEWCKFSGGYNDGINPFVNVSVDSCFVCDKAGYLASGSAHTDGLQIYGHESAVTNNISITNTRFEIPAIPQSGNKAYVNACVFIGLEYNSAMNISVNNCIMNGGGFCIYSGAVDPYTLTNVSFNDIRFGMSRRWGDGTSKMNADTVYSNFSDLDSLYVASVWKTADGNAHLSVSNDTLVERKLKVYTDKGVYDYTIPGCPSYDSIAMDSMTYEDFPFDLDVVVPDDPQYVVCFDVTSGEKQIRFYNWTSEKVYIQKIMEEVVVEDVLLNAAPMVEEVVLSGNCGRNVEYKLYNTGKLVLSGQGATYNYNSNSKSPWFDCKDDVTEVYVEEGITQLGSKLFLQCGNLGIATLPEGVASIGDCAFQSCKSLREVYIPRTLEKIGSYVMSGTILETVYYGGEESDWETIEIGVKNSQLQDAEIVFMNGNVVLEGTCGKNATWKMYSTGKLVLSGTGATTNFSSNNRSGWYEYRDLVTEVVVEEGITQLGSQAFLSCKNLSSITIPESLLTIGSNVFQSCKGLDEITLPKSVTSIGSFAFHSSGVTTVKYLGSQSQWAQISLGNKSGLENAAIICSE